ncbi:hypothetical protein [Achromobacter xylosoxidans]|uniref:hypothetical protein n=1 Tax=Alcaligenes xylosoxydans xylosoxydans TaxID=85698 RepID=UPI0006C00E8D|nr:hypothetical protein [Achromobacter xylosoxidans]CUI28437.1 Uncharacterised protein [Achromobacter xylosoxidans]
MKTAIAVPYKRAGAHRLAAGQWEILSTELPSPLPPSLSGLDYGSVLRLRREVVIDVDGLRADCGLATNVPLLAVASWSSTGTMLRRSLVSIPISDGDGTCLIELAGEIVGSDIAGALHIDTAILTAGRPTSGAPLTARHAGAVLLQDRQTIQLDSSHSFFPVEVVDFSKGFWANREAGWRLSWNVLALDQPFLGSVRLLINAAHPRVVHAVSGDAPNAEASAIRSAIYFDTAKALILGALASEDFLERDGDYVEGSCGKVIYTMIQMLFPGDGIGGLSAAASQRPDHFSTDLQGRLKLFWS